MRNVNTEKLKVLNTSNIREAVKHMDFIGLGFIFLIDNADNVSGIITDGDFRRAVLKGVNLDDKASSISNRNFIHLDINASEKKIINTFITSKINILPVLSKNKVQKILFREDYNLNNKIVLPEDDLDITVIIMAGGKGTRMAPFTNIFPKPLIPLGDKSMLEVIMDEYQKFGFNNFSISINYKGGLIKAYLNELNHNYRVSYLEEDNFLGTAGALKLFKKTNNNPIFVSNCDILIKDNYLNILEFHKEQENDLTIVAAMTHLKIPYGVCKIKPGGELIEISEKPEYDNLVNTGMYVLNPNVLELIPANTFFHITHLMEKIKLNGGKVSVYPVSEKSWIDVGQWNEYDKVIKELKS